MSNGPGVDPRDRTAVVAALDEDGGSDCGDGLGEELEGDGFRGGGSGEEAHHKLVRRRAMEPPLEVGGEEVVDGFDVAGAQRFIQGEYHPLVVGFLQSFL
ncbi:hypothetical protein U1Q18_026319 [Sarracenia purpurea var. burkii]